MNERRFVFFSARILVLTQSMLSCVALTFMGEVAELGAASGAKRRSRYGTHHFPPNKCRPAGNIRLG